MADDTDFAALYRELGVSPDCTPEQFRHAYRRRVGQLHPDQRGDEGDVARLQELNRLHDAAQAFLQAHGRLPGAAGSAHAVPHDARDRGAFDSHAHAPDISAHEDASQDKSGSGPYSRYFVMTAVLAVVVLALRTFGTPGGSGEATTSHAAAAGKSAVGAGGMGKVMLGMDKQQVRAIQGTPLGHHAVRWDYGPSWIDFGCGEVVSDWYSSPLRPLEVGTPHPTPTDWDRFDAALPAGCEKRK